MVEVKDIESTVLSQALRDINSGFRGLIISGLWGASKGLLVDLLAKEITRPFLVLTGKTEEAEALARDIAFFAGEENVISFPATGVFPYEMLSSHPEVSARRMNALNRLQKGQGKLVITSLEAMMERLI